MGNFQRTVLTACAATLVTATLAQAGGTFRYPPQPVVSVPEAIPVPVYPSWYFRGDIGLGLNVDPDMSRAGTSFSGEEMDESFVGGIGLGYIFSDNIRGDLTVDYRDEGEVTGFNSATSAEEQFGISSTVFLANVYYDFRGRDDFTPYAGVGLGLSLNEPGNNDHLIDLAAAAMAGITYRLSDDWLVDAGYRFLYLGDAKADATATAAETKFSDLMAHEIRLGFRYEFE